jgi:Tfp pilus tip-associated adhesin PilY1
VDTDSDGFLDRVYVGTTLGLLYRVDLTVDGSGQFPVLEAVNDIRDINGSLHNGSRVMAADWDPVAIFSATPNQLPTPIDPADITTPLPMFFRPSVLFVAELGKYAVAFGTGDREDLWRSTAAEGRFYLFVDDTDTSGATLPLFEDDLEEISPTGAVRADNLLLSPPAGNLRGWFMRLEPMERVVSDAFSVSGVTVFSSFQPTTGVGQITGSCANRGVNRLFGVSTTNANAILFALGNRTRFIVEETLVSQPFVEQGQTSNEGDSNLTADELQNLEDIMNELKTLFPPNCKFANYRLDIKAVRADTGLVHIAPVPICIVQKNWKEF